KKAIAAAREMGAAAALSGAGPSVAAFVQEGGESVAERMAEVFSGEGLETRRFVFSSANRGAQVNTKDQSV
ncbi:MAG: homoserine kinase, partial [Anaerolineae bacterium]|nr:homoserine kinase [Anaerolineae bacterium]